MQISVQHLRSPTSKSFAFKVGLAAGAVYYVSEQGVWKNSIETTKLCGRMYENLSPYLQQAKEKIPVEVPQLPSANRVTFLTKHYWNRGVSATFVFLGDLPQHVGVWTRKGYEAATSNPEIKNFIASFSGGTPQPIEANKK